VAGHLVEDQRALLAEVESLGRSVDHIKEIGHAAGLRARGRRRRGDAARGALLADALRMRARSSSHHRVELRARSSTTRR
jgi:hypothetical protein